MQPDSITLVENNRRPLFRAICEGCGSAVYSGGISFVCPCGFEFQGEIPEDLFARAVELSRDPAAIKETPR